MMDATPTKLRDGSWGAKVKGTPAIGDVVKVTTKAGKTWNAKVERIVTSGDDWTIVATSSLDRAAASTSNGRGRRWQRRRRTGCSCGSLEDFPRDSDCASCQHDY